MGLFLRQDENRSELQSKVAADLQQKLHQTAAIEDATKPEPRFLENQHETRPAGMIIGLLLVVFVGLVIYLLTMSQR